MKNNKNWTQKDIGVALNNAVAAAMGSPALKNLTEGRKRQLRSYLSAILDSILEHRKNGHLTAEELVFILSSGALFVHVWLVAKGTEVKLAMYQDLATEIVQDINTDLDTKEKEKGKKKNGKS